MSNHMESLHRKPRVVAITNLFPLPWQPFRGMYNKVQFSKLAEHCELDVLVPVFWTDWLKHKSYPRDGTIGDLRVRYTPYFYTPIVGRSLYGLTMFVSLLFQWRWFSQIKAEMMLISFAYPDGVAGVMLARCLGIPSMVMALGSDINLSATYKLRATQISKTMNWSNGVISVSQDLKRKISQIGVDKNKIHVIYNGVNRDCFFPRNQNQMRIDLGVSQEKKVILFVGHLYESKGVVDLLAAFRNVYQLRSDILLYYIGRGRDAKQITALAKKWKLNDCVTLLGEQCHEDIACWYSAADLVALPSHREGVPNVLLESMACGTPVLATRVGGIPEIVSDNIGMLVEAHDIDSITMGLYEALSRKWLRSNILKRSEEFSWEKNIVLIHKLIEQTIKKAETSEIFTVVD